MRGIEAHAEPQRGPSFVQAAQVVTGPLVADLSAHARAAAAYGAVFAIYQGLIDEARNNASLSAADRGRAILSLRQRQEVEAAAARNLILEEERAAMRRQRRERRAAAFQPR